MKFLAGTPPILLCAAALMWPTARWNTIPIMAGLAWAAWMPARRAEALSALAIGCFLMQALPESSRAGWGLKPVLFALCWVGLLIALTPVMTRLKRPVLWLHLGTLALLATLGVLNTTGVRVVGSAVAIQRLAAEFLWRSTYWIKWRQRAKDGARPLDLLRHLYALIPFYRTGGVPLGKQPEYMARNEARDAESLRASQVEGLRLLLLALLWRLIQTGMNKYLWPADHTLIPTLPILLQDPLPFSLVERWAGLFAELIRSILELALWWHTLVGICNLAGYRIPRNTNAPLLASTILDFWNRYFFYFKELLVDFFFFPVFLRLKGWNREVRSALATFAAAFFGNLYYHAVLYSSLVMEGQPGYYGEWVLSRAVYCAALAAGLAWSMYRTLRQPAGFEKPLARRIFGVAAAATFYAVIHIWNAGGKDTTFGMRLDLMWSLVWF